MKKINRHLTVLALGFNGGLIYAFLGVILTAYLNDNRISLAVIGFLSLRMLPYSFKPMWAPFVDNLHIKLFHRNFGQRKAWAITSQCMIIFFVIILGIVNVQKHINLFFIISLLVAFMYSTADIALDGYRIELFGKRATSKGGAVTMLGFTAGLLVSGSFGLYLASVLSWQTVFFLIIMCLIPGLLVISLSKDNRILKSKNLPIKFRYWVKENFTQAVITLFRRDKIIFILLIIGFYKMSDGYLQTMLIPFLTQVGFLKVEIAIAKACGTIGTVLGGFAAIKIIKRLGMLRSLLIAEILAAGSNLLFPLLIFKQNKFLLYVVNSIDTFCGGICYLVLLTYMSSMCTNKKFTASHFAILTSISVVFRTLLSGTSGWMVNQTGWNYFFIISAALSLPSILCMYFLFFRNKKLFT
jgi:MFS transporter, PAT family, beta-lactamase induction signal transducer AmpG